MKQTAVEWLVDKLDLNVFESDEEVSEVIEQAKEIEDSQATDYAKWSMEINELTGHFFTFSEWLKDDPKDH